jgi:adenosylcobinamide-phosphate synthase
MSFLSLLAALVLGYYRPESQPDWLRNIYRPYAAWLEQNFNDGRKQHGMLAWIIAVLLPVVIVGIAYIALDRANAVLGALFSVAILYFVLRVGRFGHMPERISNKLRENKLNEARTLLEEWQGGDAHTYDAAHIAKVGIEATLRHAHYDLFAPIFWFFLLGPAGALLYRVAYLLKVEWADKHDGFGDFPLQAFDWLDWLPARFTAASFAVVGDFEDAVYCWRTQAAAWPNEAQGIILASGAGALGVRLGETLPAQGVLEYRPELGMGDDADADYLQSATGLVWRVLVVMMGLLLLLTFAHWLGN